MGLEKSEQKAEVSDVMEEKTGEIWSTREIQTIVNYEGGRRGPRTRESWWPLEAENNPGIKVSKSWNFKELNAATSCMNLKWILPRASGKKCHFTDILILSWQNLGFTSNIQNYEIINLCCFMPLVIFL